MPRLDEGKGRLKAIFAVLVFVAAIYCGYKIIPVYVNNYELNDRIHQMAIDATVQRTSADVLRKTIVSYANNELNLPVKDDDVKVTVGSTVTINIDYTVPIDLKIYTLMLHFTPSAENRQI